MIYKVKDLTSIKKSIIWNKLFSDYVGDLSLALDPHPPPETPSATESLEVSMMTEGTPVQEPTLPRIPPVLKDMTNIPRTQGEKSPVKKPGIVRLQHKVKS